MGGDFFLARRWKDPCGGGGAPPPPSNDGGSDLTYMKHMILIGGEKAYTWFSHGTWKSWFQEIGILQYSFTCSFGVFCFGLEFPNDHVDGKKKNGMDIFADLELQTIIHFSNSIHSYFFPQISRLCKSYWKNACLAKRCWTPSFHQDSWGFLKASKDEQRQRSKVSPEDFDGNLVVQVVSSKKPGRPYKWAYKYCLMVRKSSGFHRKGCGGFPKMVGFPNN